MRKIIAISAILAASHAFAGDTPSPDGASVYFIDIEDGATVTGPVTVRFGLSGMGVAPSGVEKENTGHHHLFVDRAPLGEGAADAELMEIGIPSDANHRHFGGGQTEVTLELSPGEHSLQLVLADEFHVPHDPPVASQQITVLVK